MPAGIQVYAQDGSGILQIDDTNLNLFLRAKGTAQSTTQPNPSYQYSTSSNTNVSGVRCATPLVVLSGSQLCQCNPVNQGNGNWLLQFSINGPVGTPLSWWLFDTLGNDEGSRNGLQIFNAAGQLQYDAMRKPLRIVGVQNNNIASSVTYPAGRSYAALMSGGGGSRAVPGTQIPGQPETPAGFVILTGGSRVSGTTVSIGSYQVFGGRGDSFNNLPPVQALVADVTDY